MICMSSCIAPTPFPGLDNVLWLRETLFLAGGAE